MALFNSVNFTALILGLFPAVFRLALCALPNPFRFYVFFIYIGFTFLIASIWFLFTLPVFILIGRHDLAQYTTSHLWYNIVTIPCGIRMDIEGTGNLIQRQRQGPCVILMNHQSEMDFLLAANVCNHPNSPPAGQGLERELTRPQVWPQRTVACMAWWTRRIPVVGQYLRLCRTVFVDPPTSTDITNKQIVNDTAHQLREEGLNLLMCPVRCLYRVCITAYH
jgi:1-acyl-sn-glycerol-3-phosphate acyltransferase